MIDKRACYSVGIFKVITFGGMQGFRITCHRFCVIFIRERRLGKRLFQTALLLHIAYNPTRCVLTKMSEAAYKKDFPTVAPVGPG
jgi:hypothetical protein